METGADSITRKNEHHTSGELTIWNHVDHALARFGVRRNRHRVDPGLYTLRSPTENSPVFVSANYTLSFDALRVALQGMDAFLLVLDTKGINVWCAAGKGTFGTEEIVNKIEETGLANRIGHRSLIVPQLGAPGVAAHEVKERSGFRIEYGPVRAEDIPEYLKTGKATPEMRKVEFKTRARAVLIPVEAIHILLPIALLNVILMITGVINRFYNFAFAGFLAGVVLFPMLMPVIPTKDFSSKGFVIGAIAALPIIIQDIILSDGTAWYTLAGAIIGSLLLVSTISAYISLNFTGSSTFTSRTGVKREMFRYIPIMALALGIGLVLYIVLPIFA